MSSSAATVSAQDVNPTVPQGLIQFEPKIVRLVCHSNDRMNTKYNTLGGHSDWLIAQDRCGGKAEQDCATGWGEGRCKWGIPPQFEPVTEAFECKSAVTKNYNDIQSICVRRYIDRGLLKNGFTTEELKGMCHRASKNKHDAELNKC